MSNLETAFRLLRHHWFVHHLQSHPHEREWETEDEENFREAYNADRRKRYDEITERIIAGEKLIVAPLCAWDMDKEEA